MTASCPPNRYVWDFWYSYEQATGLFHVLYLNATPDSAALDQHHFEARLGYAVTRDFVDIDWIDHDVFSARADGWDNSSIWSGDLLPCRDGYLLFYTSRDRARDDGMTQSIGAAFSPGLRDWSRLDSVKLDADPRWYETMSVEGDDSIHAWRDPFLFRHAGATYMLVAAKDRNAPPGRKGAVGLLRAASKAPFAWETLPPLAAPGWYSEMEVPQLYRDDAGQLMLVYSCWAKFDHAPGTEGQGGLQGLAITDDLKAAGRAPTVLMPESERLYACRIVPELDGDIVGFDMASGGIRRAFKPTGWQSVDRDFSDLDVNQYKSFLVERGTPRP